LKKRSVDGPATPGEIRLDRNEQPFAPSPKVVEAIRLAADQAHRYPASGSPALKQRIAGYNDIHPDQVVVGNGSDENIELMARTFLANGDEVIIPRPSFFYYATTTQAVGGVPVFVERDAGFSVNCDSIFSAVTDRTKILYLAQPNNPTGTPIPRLTLEAILDRADFLVCVDECYYEFYGHTVLDLLPKYPHLVVMRSFSKAFGLAGVRVGYTMSSPELADHMMRAAQSYSVNRMAQVAALAALDDLPYARAKIEAVRREREFLAEQLRQRRFLVYPSETNFLLVNGRPLGRTSAEVCRKLRERKIFVADFGAYPGLDEYSFRITIGTPPENRALLGALDAWPL
jgi:histidinol-phosphate aminotransferase